MGSDMCIRDRSLNENTVRFFFKIFIIEGGSESFDCMLKIKTSVITFEARLRYAFVFIAVDEVNSSAVALKC